VYAVTDATRAIHPAEGERLLGSWRQRGVRLTTTEAVLAGAE
jgi:hypothetical protein